MRIDTNVAATGNKTGIVVPEELIGRLGAGQRPSVVVSINGYEYRNSVRVVGSGKRMISISAAVREETGIKGGDPIHVEVDGRRCPPNGRGARRLPKGFTNAKPDTSVFFPNLSNSVQRYHIDNINGAKTSETRQRRYREGGLALPTRKAALSGTTCGPHPECHLPGCEGMPHFLRGNSIVIKGDRLCGHLASPAPTRPALLL